MTAVQITPVDPADREALLAWNALLRDGYTAGRDAVWWASEESTLAQYGNPKPGRISVLLLARLDDEPVGAAGAEVDPGNPAQVELSVLPGHRRRGVGRALAAAARAALDGHASVVQAETSSEAGVAFARDQGMRIGNQEHRLLRAMPLPPETEAATPAPTPGLEIRTWHGACPEDLVEDWARLTTQMDADVPMGDLTRPASRGEVEDLRRSEQRMDEQGWTLVRGLALLEGTAVGYTEIFVNRHDPEILTQDDTLVERAHRGRGIGRALKLANLENLRAVPEAAQARWIQTYTALDNEPMLALNRSLGFREADVLSILEGTTSGT
ncbi:GNAT family N-acetyltransferase [Brachybacterium sp. J144]|uniref:GNAT family N-acetyltransferase n=1 Tax=Brachybacterium sp. J144 TaxID=3116487 RepID=UPI002E771607|nr:GNAT family N-acetyltransferase [Brachybacterium sp. J144]MEE1650824.1 GNAT family N-acetyltransferase [Brachybacterium sp. J144]